MHTCTPEYILRSPIVQTSVVLFPNSLHHRTHRFYDITSCCWNEVRTEYTVSLHDEQEITELRKHYVARQVNRQEPKQKGQRKDKLCKVKSKAVNLLRQSTALHRLWVS